MKSYLLLLALPWAAMATPAAFNASPGFGTFINSAKGGSEVAMEELHLVSDTTETDGRHLLTYTVTVRNTGGGYHGGGAFWLDAAATNWPVEIVSAFIELPDLEPNSASVTPTGTVSLRVASSDLASVRAALESGQHSHVSSTELFQFTHAPVPVDSATDSVYMSYTRNSATHEVTIDFSSATPLLNSLTPGQLLIENPSMYKLHRQPPIFDVPGNALLASLISSTYDSVWQTGQPHPITMVQFTSLTPISGGVRLTGTFRGITEVLQAGTFIATQLDAFDGGRDFYNPPVGNGFWTAAEIAKRGLALEDALHVGPRHPSLPDLLGLFNLHYAFNDIPIKPGITLDGELLLRGMDVAIDMKWRNAVIKKLAFTLSSRADLTMRITAEAGSRNDNDPLIQKEKQIVYAPLPPIVIPIGDVGIEIDPKLTAKIGCSVNAQGRIVVPLQTHLHAGCRMSWDDSKPEGQKIEYTPIQSTTPDAMSEPTISGSVTGHASAWAEASFQTMIGITDAGVPGLAGIVGPEITARVQGDLTFNSAASPWWSTSGSADVAAKLRFALLGLTIADPQFGSFHLADLFSNHATRPPDVVNGPLDNASGNLVRWARAVKSGVGGPSGAMVARVIGTAEDVFIALRTSLDNNLVMRVNGKGEVVWTRGGIIFSPQQLVSSPDGGCVVAGMLFGTPTLTKLDGNGDLVWNRDFRITDASNGFHNTTIVRMLVSYTNTGYDYFMIGGHDNNLNALDSDVWMAKFDADGNMQWAKQFITPDGEFPSDAAMLPDGNIVIAGTHTQSPDGSNPPGPGAAGGGWLMKVNKTGTALKSVRTEAALGMNWSSVTVAPDGMIYTAGQIGVTVFFSAPTLQVGKYNSDLNLLGMVTIGEGVSSGAQDIAIVPDHSSIASTILNLTGDPLHFGQTLLGVQDYLPNAGNTVWDNGARIRWTPGGIIVLGTTALANDTAAYCMSLTDELGVRWMNSHERFNSNEYLLDACATDGGIVCVGGSSQYFETATHNGSADNACALIFKLPFEGRIELHPAAHGLDKYMHPIVHDSIGSQEMPTIVSPDLKYHGTTVLNNPATSVQPTTFGNAQGPLTSITITGWIPLERGNPNAPMTYPQWAAYNQIPGAAMSDDFDGDGRSNGQEWFFGGDPQTWQNGTPPFTTVRNSDGTMSFSFTKSRAAQLHLPHLDSGTDLQNWIEVTLPTLAVTPLDSFTDQISFTLPPTSDVRRFYRTRSP